MAPCGRRRSRIPADYQDSCESLHQTGEAGARAAYLRRAGSPGVECGSRLATVRQVAARFDRPAARSYEEAPAETRNGSSPTVPVIKIAIAGAGAITERAHIPALRSVADAQIVAIQSRTADKAERVARAIWPGDAGRPKVYSDFDEMLARERPDAVGIFTPN